MPTWPKPESNVIPEGHYTFRLREEPVFEPFDYTEKKTGKQGQGTRIIIFVVGTNGIGEEFSAREQMPAWDPRYTDLCEALGVDHGRDIKMAGARFEGDVIHEPDKKDLTKSWPRIIKIKRAADAPADADDDVPAGDDAIPF
jgi:hypothetical protein